VKRKAILKRLLPAVTFAVVASLGAYAHAGAHEAAHPHWSYEGEGGPAHWGEVSPDFESCSKGKSQSPIDIANPAKDGKEAVTFDYKQSKLNVVNNGHTVQVNYDKGSSIKINGVNYDLVQFHFHDPSEHTVNGKSYGMELHLVHKNAKNELAVIGVLIENGSENPAFKALWANLPAGAGEKKELAETINATDFLPTARSFYHYAGSLTTPPCSEGVSWFVIEKPIQMSEAQIARFKEIIKGNNRPVQPLNGRKVVAE
jgi:carbonic anhydrase